MAIIDDRTTNLNLPLPNIGNKLVDDVARLRTAFSSVDTAVALKADAETTYSKAQVDTAIAGATPSFSTLTGKPTTVAGFGITDVMTSTATQTALNLKANQATTYTKTETDTRIQAVVGAAPAALDTLAEIAAQLASDGSAAGALTTTVSLKVDKVSGKGLSTEDFTTAEKTKLAAQVIPTTLPASDVSAWAKSATKPTYTATEVGLANVNNTTDLLKPVSTATTAAIGVETTRAMAAEALKAPVASPTFTGSVTANTILASSWIGAVTTTNGAINTLTSTGDLGLEARGNGTGPALISLHRPGNHAAYLGLDTDNKLKYGGWSLGANSYEVLHQGNLSTYLASPALTGTPTAPTALATDNSTTVATTAYVNTRITNLINVAPAALDTLGEIATQLASDQSAAAALTTAVSLKAPLASPTFTGTVSGVTKAMVGLGSVDNTADAAKPVSTATQTALNLKVDSSTLGTMSTQSAAAVAITGGTINGITFSGGTY
jgi:hypothetical protein